MQCKGADGGDDDDDDIIAMTNERGTHTNLVQTIVCSSLEDYLSVCFQLNVRVNI